MEWKLFIYKRTHKTMELTHSIQRLETFSNPIWISLKWLAITAILISSFIGRWIEAIDLLCAIQKYKSQKKPLGPISLRASVGEFIERNRIRREDFLGNFWRSANCSVHTLSFRKKGPSSISSIDCLICSVNCRSSTSLN